VLKYKDHPALLAWGIGNELNLQYKNTRVWDAVNDISKMIHELDPNHPTSTILAGVNKDLVGLIKQKTTDIDTDGEVGGLPGTVNGISCDRSFFRGTEGDLKKTWPFAKVELEE
jgi:beta-galactosidase/beta-glucuronidase